jgi:hypothetical protein
MDCRNQGSCPAETHLDCPAQVPDADSSRLATRMRPRKRGVEKNMVQNLEMINTDIKSYQVLEIEMAGLLVVFGSDLWCDQIELPKFGWLKCSGPQRWALKQRPQPPPAVPRQGHLQLCLRRELLSTYKALSSTACPMGFTLLTLACSTGVFLFFR